MLYPIELRARFRSLRRQMAERRGFEPPDRFYPINRLAGGCLQPLGHLSTTGLAEGVGFEPTELSLSGFQDRRLKPLGHPSVPCGTRRYAFCDRRVAVGRPSMLHVPRVPGIFEGSQATTGFRPSASGPRRYQAMWISATGEHPQFTR